jgi:ribosomal protein L29
MKTKEKKELQEKTRAELDKMLSDARQSLFSLRMEKEQGKLKNMASLSTTRKNIAIIMTALTKKQKEVKTK